MTDDEVPLCWLQQFNKIHGAEYTESTFYMLAGRLFILASTDSRLVLLPASKPRL